MPEVRPFRAVRYNPQTVPDLAAVLAPPYDIISPEEHHRLLDRDPHNIVRLTLGDRDDPTPWHPQAAARLQDWLRRQVLIRDATPGFYVYTQTFASPTGEQLTRTAVLGMVRAGKAYPHERTQSGPKEDRLKLMRATHFSLSPVFGFYPPDTRGVEVLSAATQRPPAAEATDSAGVVHRLWNVTNADDCRTLQGSFLSQPVYIADGHHRYETALAYQQEQLAAGAAPDSPINYVLMALVATDDPGLVILPTHRVVRLPAGVRVEDVLRALDREAYLESVPPPQTGELAAAVSQLAVCNDHYVQFGVYAGDNRWYLLRLTRSPSASPLKRLGVVMLQDHVLHPHAALDAAALDAAERIRYPHDPAQAVTYVDREGFDLAFFLPAPNIEDVQAVAHAGECMPQKATYFYPKLVTGLALADLRDW